MNESRTCMYTGDNNYKVKLVGNLIQFDGDVTSRVRDALTNESSCMSVIDRSSVLKLEEGELMLQRGIVIQCYGSMARNLLRRDFIANICWSFCILFIG